MDFAIVIVPTRNVRIKMWEFVTNIPFSQST